MDYNSCGYMYFGDVLGGAKHVVQFVHKLVHAHIYVDFEGLVPRSS